MKCIINFLISAIACHFKGCLSWLNGHLG